MVRMMMWMMMYIHTHIYRYPKRNVMIHEAQDNSLFSRGRVDDPLYMLYVPSRDSAPWHPRPL